MKARWLAWWFSLPASALSLAVIGFIRVYQQTLSRCLGPRCRFYPRCSEYTILALKKYGLLSGLSKGAKRVLKCHPWHPGGYDPP